MSLNELYLEKDIVGDLRSQFWVLKITARHGSTLLVDSIAQLAMVRYRVMQQGMKDF